MRRHAATLRRASRVVAVLAFVVPAVLAFTGAAGGLVLPALLFGGLATAGALNLWASSHLGTEYHERLVNVALARGLQLRRPADPGRADRVAAFTVQAQRAHRRNRELPRDDTEAPPSEAHGDALPGGVHRCCLLAVGTHDRAPIRLALTLVSRTGSRGHSHRDDWYVSVAHRVDVHGELHVRRGAVPPTHVLHRDLPRREVGDVAFDDAHIVHADRGGARLLTSSLIVGWERTVGHARVSVRDGWLVAAHRVRDPAQAEAAARSLLDAVEVLAAELRAAGT